ncbi:hypothetical protein H9P43_001370 [Blastocladiella emersonii ATCC 22665]|nr:hypothetical protein H9P43_001370 [Blastocladiella emersonii ATCC 22665]
MSYFGFGQHMPQQGANGSESTPAPTPVYVYAYPSAIAAPQQQQQQQQQLSHSYQQQTIQLQHTGQSMAGQQQPSQQPQQFAYYAPAPVGTPGAQPQHLVFEQPQQHHQQHQQQQQPQQPQYQQGFHVQGGQHVLQVQTHGTGQPAYYVTAGPPSAGIVPGTPSSLPRSHYSVLHTSPPMPSPGILGEMDEDTMSHSAAAAAAAASSSSQFGTSPPTVTPKVQEGFFVSTAAANAYTGAGSQPPGTPTNGSGPDPSSPMHFVGGSSVPNSLIQSVRNVSIAPSKPASGTTSLLKQAQVAAAASGSIAASANAAAAGMHSMSLPNASFEWFQSPGSSNPAGGPGTAASSFDPSGLAAVAAASAAAAVGGTTPQQQHPLAIPMPSVGTPLTVIGSQASSLPYSMTGSPIASSFFENDDLDPNNKNLQMMFEKRRKRRESHNAVERRRRDNINERIGEIALMLPEYYVGSDPNIKPNKGQTLRKAVDYIRHVQQTLKEAHDRYAELENALRNLGVEPPESTLLQTIQTLLAVPPHSVAAHQQLLAQQQQYTTAVSPGLPQSQQQSQSQQEGSSAQDNSNASAALSPSQSTTNPGTPAVNTVSLPSPGANTLTVNTGGASGNVSDAMNVSVSPTMTTASLDHHQQQQQQQHQQQQQQTPVSATEPSFGILGEAHQHYNPQQQQQQQMQFAQYQQQPGSSQPQQPVMVMYSSNGVGMLPLQGHGLVPVLPQQ